MPAEIHWNDIALRLFLTSVAGAIIGLNRGEHGRPAGLRTTMLVALAASLSMIEVNVLLPVRGKFPDSFAVLDLMRLPLGILSGMGFIGAGAILRKDSAVRGVTTAATLWFVTMVGLCFGGGQLVLGGISTGLGWFILCGLKPLEHICYRDRQAQLVITTVANGPTEREVVEIFESGKYRVSDVSVKYEQALDLRELRCKLKWVSNHKQVLPPELVTQLAKRSGVMKLEWNP